jgi:HK97 gp10 family phage protein
MASKVKVSLSGFGKLRKRVEDEVFKALYVATDLITKEAALSITKGSISGKKHVPSRPGQPPNADTRQLDTSIVTIPHRETMSCQSVAQAPHAIFMELGTSRIAPRPFMRPALANNTKEVNAIISAAVKRATMAR